MKLNINKLQVGGLLYSSTVNPVSNLAVKARQSQVVGGESSTQSLIPKEVMNKLYTEGIPTDVDKFSELLAKFEQEADFSGGIKSSDIYRLSAQANRIIKQSGYFDKAVKSAETNKSFDEIAVDSRGYMYIVDEESNIKKVHGSKCDLEKYQPLTINELIQFRSFNPQLADSADAVSVIGNSIGIEKINEYIKNIIATVGSSDSISEAYQDLAGIIQKDLLKRPNEEQYSSIQNLYQLMKTVGPDAIFKVKDRVKEKNIDSALSYIYNMLSTQMRMQLAARNLVQGGTWESGGKYASNLILNALVASNDTIVSRTMDYDSGINKAAGTSSSTREHQTNMTGLEQLIQGTLGSRAFTIVNKYNPDLAFTLYGNGLGKLTDAENKIVNESILQEALDKGLGALIDSNNIYFGDQKISPNLLDQIVYDGYDVVNVWAPTRADGSIDFGKLKQYEEVKETIKNNPYLKQEDIAKLLNDIGINGTIDARGNFIGQDPSMAQFIVVTGITSDEVVDSSNSFATKLSKSDKDQTFRRIKQLYASSNKGRKGDAKYEFPQGWFEWSTDLLAAPVFMRVGETARFDAGTIVGNGARITSQPYESLIQKDQAVRINKPSSSIL